MSAQSPQRMRLTDQRAEMRHLIRHLLAARKIILDMASRSLGISKLGVLDKIYPRYGATNRGVGDIPVHGLEGGSWPSVSMTSYAFTPGSFSPNYGAILKQTFDIGTRGVSHGQINVVPNQSL